MGTIAVSKMTSKGQVTVPEAVRKQLRLEKGDRLEWETTERGTVAVRKISGRLSDLVGLLGRPERSATIEDLDEGIRRSVRKRHVRR